jgi:hypothetical protein
MSFALNRPTSRADAGFFDNGLLPRHFAPAVYAPGRTLPAGHITKFSFFNIPVCKCRWIRLG